MTDQVPNKCGTCSMCCRLPAIPQLDKPMNDWCKACKPGKGCTIYATRPDVCREYDCMWLHSQEDTKPLGIEYRPDKCGVMITPTTDDKVLNAMVVPSSPLAWREGKIGELIKRIASKGIRVVVSHGPNLEKTLVEPRPGLVPGVVHYRKVKMTPMDDSGMQYYLPEDQS